MDYKKLFEIIEFLSKEKGVAVGTFIEEVEERMKEKKIAEFRELLSSLPNSEKAKIFNELSSLHQISKEEKMNVLKNSVNARYSLEYLEQLKVKGLVNTKPCKMFLDDKEIHVSSWNDITIYFGHHLVMNGDLKKENLPIYLSPRSKKSFINETGEPDSGRDGIFKKIGEGIYIDVKYNAYYHIKNMINTLKILNITTKYKIEIEI